MVNSDLINLLEQYLVIIEQNNMPNGYGITTDQAHCFSDDNFYLFAGEVSEVLAANFNDAEKEKFRNLLKGDDKKHKTASGKMRGYFMSLIEIVRARQLGEYLLSWSSVSGNSNQEKNSELVSKSTQLTESNHVFIVHGHDKEAKETVARFIENLGSKVIILHEKPDSGKTIIEKFESFAGNTSYAVVLLTPDDLGAAKNNAAKPKFRARQNVIFELGFFVAKLGRKNVVALCKGDIELPSDYHGVLYIPMDIEGAWKMKLAKEMKTAGLFINFENVF